MTFLPWPLKPHTVSHHHKSMLKCSYLKVTANLFLVLLGCGDIETNPSSTLYNNLVFSHSNVRTLLVKRSEEKIADLHFIATEHKIDVISRLKTRPNYSVCLLQELLTLTCFRTENLFFKQRVEEWWRCRCILCKPHSSM